MPISSVGNKRQVRGAAQNTRDGAVNKAEEAEEEDRVVEPNRDPEPEPGPTGREDLVDEHGNDEEDVECDGLHGVEPDKVGEVRVSDDSQVEGEEGDEGGVRDGPVE